MPSSCSAFDLVHGSTNDRRLYVFADIKGNSSPRLEDELELMRSHPVAISGLWMHAAVQSRYTSQRSAFNCEIDPAPASRSDRHKSVCDCARRRWSATTDRSVCGHWQGQLSLCSASQSAGLFDVIREAD